MIVLGIETATERVGVAIGSHEGLVGSIEVGRGKRHAETLTPAIEFLMRQCELELADLDAIAVDVGPGLFTGMRVGLSTAKALGYALDVPLVPVMSVDLLAAPLSHSARTVVSVVDGRRGEVFYAMYRNSVDAQQRVAEPVSGSITDLAADIQARGQESMCVGDGAEKYRRELSEVVEVEFADAWLAHPSAVQLVRTGVARAIREDWVPAVAAEAAYLRAPDAQINWQTRHGAVGG